MRTTLTFTKALLQGSAIGLVIYLTISTGWLIGSTIAQLIPNPFMTETQQEIF